MLDFLLYLKCKSWIIWWASKRFSNMLTFFYQVYCVLKELFMTMRADSFKILIFLGHSKILIYALIYTQVYLDLMHPQACTHVHINTHSFICRQAHIFLIFMHRYHTCTHTHIWGSRTHKHIYTALHIFT